MGRNGDGSGESGWTGSLECMKLVIIEGTDSTAAQQTNCSNLHKSTKIGTHVE